MADVDFLARSPPLVRRKILSYHRVDELLKLRRVSRMWSDIIDDFIATSTSFDLSQIKHGKELFLHITENCDYLLELDLSYCNWISDQLISSQIENLPYLKSINLASDCCVTIKEFPELDLSATEFTDKYLISDVGIIKISEHCPNLREINLSNCLRVTNRCLAALGSNCMNLNSINLDYCSQIDNQGLESVVCNNHNLRRISIKFCRKITSHALQSIATHCPYLEVLILRGCLKVDGDGVYAIANACPKVTCIDLENCELIPGNAVVAGSRSWKRLKEINLAGCLLINGHHSSLILQNAVGLSKIKMNFQGGGRDDPSKVLTRLENIQSLVLVNSEMLNVSHLVLLALKSPVEKLKLHYGLSFTRHQPYTELFYRMNNLKSLSITNCSVVSGRALATLAEACCPLQKLSLNGCEQIDDSGVIRVAKTCKSLESVNLGGCNRISDQTLFVLSTHCTSLRKLNVDGCSKIVGSGLIQIATNCKHLRSLSCRHSTNSKEMLLIFLRKCMNLEFLDLSFCQNVDDDVIGQLRVTNLNLSRLHLDGVRNISDDSLFVFGHFEHLSVLSVVNNNNVSEEGLRSIKFRHLCVVHYSRGHQRCKMLCRYYHTSSCPLAIPDCVLPILLCFIFMYVFSRVFCIFHSLVPLA